jgi:DNA-binding response OmpR family regulator
VLKRTTGFRRILQSIHVLVVEDEASIAEMLAEILAAEGYEVDLACNGRVALEKIGAQDYDLILSDLRMPELDGVGLYWELERQHPDLLRRLIVITATTEDLDYQRFLAQIDVPVLEKPFSLLALHAVTHEVLSTRPSDRLPSPAAPMPP